MALLSFLAAGMGGEDSEADGDETVDALRCVQIALVHDIAEAVVGDITPFDGVSKDEKHRREREVVGKIEEMLGPRVGGHISRLWWEYENKSSAEGRLVKDIDKFEMVLQARFLSSSFLLKTEEREREIAGQSAASASISQSVSI